MLAALRAVAALSSGDGTQNRHSPAPNKEQLIGEGGAGSRFRPVSQAFFRLSGRGVRPAGAPAIIVPKLLGAAIFALLAQFVGEWSAVRRRLSRRLSGSSK